MSEQLADSSFAPATAVRHRVLMHLRTPFWPDGRPWAVRELPTVAVEDRGPYLQALGCEVDARAPLDGNCRVAALWVGSGAALGMADEELGRLLEDAADRYDLTGDDGRAAEVTVEAYPGLVNERSLDGLRRCGATRLFVGYRTGSPAEARGMGCEVAAEGLPTLGGALEGCPFDIEVLILVGNPGQSVASALESLETALGFGAVAVDLQAFLLGAGSPLANERLRHESSWRMDALHRIPSAAERVQIQAELGLALQDRGFSQYLPGYWAIPGHECFYRLARAAGCDVLGFGLGARSRVGDATSVNIEDLPRYLEVSGDPEAVTAERWREPA